MIFFSFLISILLFIVSLLRIIIHLHVTLIQCTDCWNVLSSGNIQGYLTNVNVAMGQKIPAITSCQHVDIFSMKCCVYQKHLFSFALIIF